MSIEVGDINGVFGIGRDNEVFGSHADNITKVMESAGYTKVLDHCCGTNRIDNVYVRNDFRSSVFKYDGKPRLMRDVNLTFVEI